MCYYDNNYVTTGVLARGKVNHQKENQSLQRRRGQEVDHTTNLYLLLS